MVHAQAISQATAAHHLALFRLVDPEGIDTVKSVCARGQAWALSIDGRTMVYVLERIGPALWITAAAGRTKAATLATLAHIEQQARAMGARLVQFQTARPGLVRLARRAGYEQNGFVLAKVITA